MAASVHSWGPGTSTCCKHGKKKKKKKENVGGEMKTWVLGVLVVTEVFILKQKQTPGIMSFNTLKCL